MTSNGGSFSPLIYLLRRDIKLSFRGNSTGLTLGFFFIALTFIPFGLGPDLALLQKLAPGLLWVALCLSVLLSLEHMFQADIEEGGFDQFLLSPVPLELICFTKALAHWVAVALPLVIVSPLGGIFLNIRPQDMFILIMVLMAGSLALSFLGMVGAALAASIVRSGFLAALLVMPLYVPVLIFGSTALAKAFQGGAVGAELTLLILMGLAAGFLTPLAAAAALRARLM
ncbi:MAG: heme exporter protein CcmB [Parvibaculales bacterium]